MKGILFKPWKVKAIVESSLDREWQTRRLDHLKEINQEPDKWLRATPAPKSVSLNTRYKGLWQFADKDINIKLVKPRHQVGEVVYIKEAWATYLPDQNVRPEVIYKSDGLAIGFEWRSPLFMLEWAARTFIKITGVRPERLQEITEEDVIKEGIRKTIIMGKPRYEVLDPKDKLLKYAPNKEFQCWRLFNEPSQAYSFLWDSINPKYPWASNPWLWVYEFRRVKK